MPAGQGNETNRYQVSRSYVSIFILGYQDEILNQEGASHGNDHPAIILELFYEGWWNVTGRSGDYDSIKRRIFIPAEVTVTDCDFNIIVA
jgi:hypothetical protein